MMNQEKSLELIEQYEVKSVLWDPKNPDYFKKSVKDDAWQEIANALETDEELCRKKMISLLASYRREKMKTRNSQRPGKDKNNLYKSNWYAYEALSFLFNRDNPRKSLNTVSGDSHADESEAESEQEVSIPSYSPPPREEKTNIEEKRMDMFTEACTVLKSESSSAKVPEDEIYFFLNFIGSKMRKYPETTKNAVQREIFDVIFRADQGYFD